LHPKARNEGRDKGHVLTELCQGVIPVLRKGDCAGVEEQQPRRPEQTESYRASQEPCRVARPRAYCCADGPALYFSFQVKLLVGTPERS
jgi:hypothetical protein